MDPLQLAPRLRLAAYLVVEQRALVAQLAQKGPGAILAAAQGKGEVVNGGVRQAEAGERAARAIR